MGKIRVATLGDEALEREKKDKRTRQRQEKKKRDKVHIPGMKGGERLVAMTGDEEIDRLAKISEEQEKAEKELAGGEIGTPEQTTPKKTKKKKVAPHSKRYMLARLKLELGKIYPIAEAVKLLRDINLTKFAASVEVHINTLEKGLRGTASLPHGSGKKLRIVIISPGESTTAKSDSIITGAEELIEKIAAGWTDFDIVIAHPGLMAKLAKVARILGPRGLMPNPKAGTISDKPQEVAKKLSQGQIQFKTETEFPIIHQVIGKMSFTDEQLSSNFKSLVEAIGPTKIKSITLKSTMSPGIKVAVT
ncbi:50S ribosomal protein L1 [Candidatus Gottesmanbacteria bacterium]|nr:50S ribosomal protein L1 [Candidatus Gottesmanbacteria bacterium]